METIPARSSTTPSGSAGDQVDLKEVLADVGKMLKAMSATSLKTVRVSSDKTKVEEERVVKTVIEDLVLKEEFTGLLDSGASHAMRPAKEDEYRDGQPVQVTLAGEDVRVLRQNNEGTILQEETGTIQPIVPLGAVIAELGYTLHWTPKTLRLTHPDKKQIKVRIKNHCPEVAASDALNLIRELEMNKVKSLNEHVSTLKARLEVLQKEEKRDWVELLRDFSRTGSKPVLLKAILTSPVTRDLPSEVQSNLVEGFNPRDGERYLKNLPISRRKRRALMCSRSWVVNSFSGDATYENDPFDAIPRAGKVVLDIDLSKSKLWNVHREGGIYQLLLWAASEGRVSDIIGSPPHGTWPTSMAPTREPDSYPVRTTLQPYGMKDLLTLKKQKVDDETACVAKQLLVWFIAQMNGQRDVGFLMEFPADCERLRECDPIRASVWTTEMWKSFRSVSGIKEVSFYMGAYGHKAKRPTTMATTYPALIQIDKNYDFHDNCVPPSLLTRSQLRQWSVSFKELVAESIKDYHSAKWESEEEMVKAGIKLSKLTKEQRDSWHRHLLNDHQPYRADCSICINAQATGYQHRRRKHPTMYSMALDLAGPFKQKGRDMEHEDYKYIMVAAYRCPKEYMSAKAIEEMDRDFYVPDEPGESEGDDPIEVLLEGPEKDPTCDSDKNEEEEVKVPFGPETLEDTVEGLAHPDEHATIYITRPLRGRTNHYVVQAAKEILLQLKQTGLHVETVHTDRAREFKAKAFHDWTVDAELRHTKTAGADPSGNSSAELGIKWAKARVRALLGAAKAPPCEWPMAIQHASAAVFAKAFPDSSWASPPATTFGNEVWFRSKAYQGKREKKHEAAGARWKKGFYRGPAMDVKRGHLIARDDGGLTVAKSVKFGVVEPEEDLKGLLSPAVGEGLPEELLVSLEPQTKLERKEEIEFRARKLSGEKNYDICEVVTLYRLLEGLGQADTRFDKKSPMTSWYSGAFVHGGVAGLRSNVKEFPYTTTYFTEFAKYHCGEVKFSALGLAKNAQLGLHRDSHNYKFSKNYVLPLQQFDQGSLWVQEEGVGEKECVTKELPNGKVIRGRCWEMQRGKVVSFSPRLWHEVQPWKGERLMLLLYTPRATKLQPEGVELLTDAGFNVDPESLAISEEEDTEDEATGDGLSAFPIPKLKKMTVEEGEVFGYAFEEMEDDDFFQGDSAEPLDLLPDEPMFTEGQGIDVHLKRMVKKAEVQYTSDIEEILEKIELHKGQLEVTHTVSLSEVKKNIDKWKSSALKEFKNLTEVKRAFTVRKRHQLPENCRIVPCKGVYTVKPDKTAPGYRRKTRFVACGNHVPENSADFDLFAAGLDATSLRTMLALNARKPWRIGTTDVRQAFVLAKWLGEPVALEPPGIAYELGLAVSGDMWYVEQAIYGLRESPALWSKFRDEQLKLARWTMHIEGVEVTMKLEQLVSDNQIWKIVQENGQGEVQGYVLVYIDDLLIHAQEEAMKGFFNWVSGKWEVDALDILDFNHPIRFLGMELHRVQDGVELAQEGFLNEILRSYNHKGARSQSQGPRETLLLSDEEERALIDAVPVEVDPKDPKIKEAQRRVGELLWLMGRTRPDLQHTVSIMAARLTRCPEMVNRVGERLLDYLNETRFYRLAFTQDCEEMIKELHVYTDSSFAPSGGRSQGAAVVFLGSCPLVWRAGRQQLVTLSTAESELLETVEGTQLGLSTRGLVTELLGVELPIVVWVDNSAAVSLLTTSSGSWRTRHLRLRSNWVREMTNRKELYVKHTPGEYQRADLGTKPFTRERLKQLIRMWSLKDRREVKEERIVKSMGMGTSWLRRLLLLCQVCGSAAQKQDIKTEVPWDLYLAIIVLAVAVIGLWEGMKQCLGSRGAKVKALRAAATSTQRGKLTRTELKELQMLMTYEPRDLTEEQKERLCDLKEKFDETMPPGCSPLPRYPTDDPPLPPPRDQPSSSTSSSSGSRNKQPKVKEMKDQSTQADFQPAFTRVTPTPPPVREVVAGPFYQVPGRDHLHVYRECWGLRNAGRVQQVTLCRCCIENGGNRIY